LSAMFCETERLRGGLNCLSVGRRATVRFGICGSYLRGLSQWLLSGNNWRDGSRDARVSQTLEFSRLPLEQLQHSFDARQSFFSVVALGHREMSAYEDDPDPAVLFCTGRDNPPRRQGCIRPGTTGFDGCDPIGTIMCPGNLAAYDPRVASVECSSGPGRRPLVSAGAFIQRHL
jgi:hypothetical protein